MNIWKRPMAVRLSAIGALVCGMTLVSAGPASAAYDDSVTITTTDAGLCGMVMFIDHGPGQDGGGDNDDYFGVYDGCPDGDGVMAWAWLNDVGYGTKYNGGGAYTQAFWDPFQVSGGDAIKMEVCRINGPHGTPYNCRIQAWNSQDG
jgi:hypothetical protein